MKVQKETPEICRHVTQTMTAHSVQDGSVLILWCFIHTHTLQEPLILVIGWALSHDPRFKGTRCLLRSRRGVVILLLSYSLWSSNHTHLTPFMIHWSGNAYLAPLPPFSLSASSRSVTACSVLKLTPQTRSIACVSAWRTTLTSSSSFTGGRLLLFHISSRYGHTDTHTPRSLSDFDRGRASQRTNTCEWIYLCTSQMPRETNRTPNTRSVMTECFLLLSLRTFDFHSAFTGLQATLVLPRIYLHLNSRSVRVKHQINSS